MLAKNVIVHLKPKIFENLGTKFPLELLFVMETKTGIDIIK